MRGAGRLLVRAALIAALMVACTENKDTPVQLESFRVTFSRPDVPRNMLPEATGRLCELGTCEDPIPCSGGAACLDRCELSGEPCGDGCPAGDRCIGFCERTEPVDVACTGCGINQRCIGRCDISGERCADGRCPDGERCVGECEDVGEAAESCTPACPLGEACAAFCEVTDGNPDHVGNLATGVPCATSDDCGADERCVSRCSEPMPVISGRLCGVTACQGESVCPNGEECVGWCEEDGAACGENSDCREGQACVKRCSARFEIDVQAMGSDGRPFPYTGPVNLDVTPGLMPPSEAQREMLDGKMENVPVFVASASGRVNVWVEQDGYRRRDHGLPGADETCVVGADNDGDGDIDEDDLCLGTVLTFECIDGLDNDQNGLTDMDDPGCLSILDSTEGEDEPAQCNNGIDDNGDGLVDMEDPGCVHELDPYEGPDYYGQCNNGKDDDGNGLIDLADPGCRDQFDDLEAPVLSAAGVTPPICVAKADLRTIQHSPAIIHSPMQSQDLTVSTGELVVTSITNTGLYITDYRFHKPWLDNGDEGYYHSIFLYNFSTPEGVVQGDLLCEFAGGLVEFQGNTQMTFPSYTPFYPGVPECAELRRHLDLPANATRNDALDKLGLLLEDVDEETGETAYRIDLSKLSVPVSERLIPAYEQHKQEDGTWGWYPVLDFRDAVDENACVLEPLESALIEMENVQVSTVYVECDQNQNGTIDEGDEWNCRNTCQDDPLCTELQSYEKYKQWAGLVDGKFKMYVNQEMLIEQTPLRISSIGMPDEEGRCEFEHFWFGDSQFRRYVCPPLEYSLVRGNLRQIYLCGKDYKEGGCPLQLFSITPTGDKDVVPVEVTPADGEE